MPRSSTSLDPAESDDFCPGKEIVPRVEPNPISLRCLLWALSNFPRCRLCVSLKMAGFSCSGITERQLPAFDFYEFLNLKVALWSQAALMTGATNPVSEHKATKSVIASLSPPPPPRSFDGKLTHRGVVSRCPFIHNVR